MKKKLVILLGGLVLVGIGSAGWWGYRALEDEVRQRESVVVLGEAEGGEKVEQLVGLRIDFGEGEGVDYEGEFKCDETVFGLLERVAGKEGLELVTEQYDFGVFVKAIGGAEGDAKRAWVYSVNGEAGQVAADVRQLAEGDHVEWKYTELEN
jgi:hypothetical protein